MFLYKRPEEGHILYCLLWRWIIRLQSQSGMAVSHATNSELDSEIRFNSPEKTEKF